MKRDLDNCGYKVPHEIQIYRRAQAFALEAGLKWLVMAGNNIRSLRRPGYSILLPDEVAIRFRRWIAQMKLVGRTQK